MKKTLLVAAVTMLCAASPQKSIPPKAKRMPAPARAAPALPIFDFMGANTETPFAGLADIKGCDVEGVKTSCYGTSLVGESRVFLGRSFNKDVLYLVNAGFPNPQYLSLQQVFRAKYGNPSKIEIRKWQSKAGATFDNTVIQWRFKGGVLELESMGSKVGEGTFSYFNAANAPETAPPPVNF